MKSVGKSSVNQQRSDRTMHFLYFFRFSLIYNFKLPYYHTLNNKEANEMDLFM